MFLKDKTLIMEWHRYVNKYNFSLVLVFLFLGALWLGFTGNKDSSYLVGNLMPELTGVCLELLVIIWIFEYWQEKRKKAKLIEIEQRLREYLIFFLTNSFKDLPKDLRIGRFFSSDNKKNIIQLDNLRDHIKANGLSEDGIISIQNHCSLESSTLDNLLPVASELTRAHFKAWCRIVFYVNNINRQTGSVSQSTLKIIQYIKKFDGASYNENLFIIEKSTKNKNI